MMQGRAQTRPRHRRPSMKKQSLLVLGVLGLLARSVYGTTLIVTDPGDSGPGTLRERVGAANPGDTITFAISGPVLLTSDQIVINKNLNITGPSGLISIERSGFSRFRIFYIGNGSANGPVVQLSNLRIAKGINPFNSPNYENGGGIYNDSGKLTLYNCTVQDCDAFNGGGLFSRPSGGGIYSTGSQSALTINSCRFMDNDVELSGGAIAKSGGSLVVTESFFGKNTADNGASHIYNAFGPASTIRQSTFTEGKGSGAISHDEGELEVSNCTFYKNA